MIIDLGLITFDNDMYQTDLPDGSILVINKLNESLHTEDEVYEATDIEIKRVNIEIIDLNGNTVLCPCIIGLDNDLMQIRTAYKQFEGLILNEDNLKYCEVEIYDKQ